MRNEEEIKKEFEQAKYLKKIQNDNRSVSVANCYWNIGYVEALRFVLGERESDTLGKIKDLKDLTDYENLTRLIKETEG